LEILPDIYIVESIVGNRFLNTYFLAGENGLLIDSGFPQTPKEVIIPYLEKIGYSLRRVKWVVNTHASADHYGGNQYLKSLQPEITIIAHESDAQSISEHAMFMREHINIVSGSNVLYPKINDPQFLEFHGSETPVDLIVLGGETLTLSKNWDVQLIHSPGHTPGHLMVYDPRNSVLFSGDALLGNGIPDIDGNLVMPPHYMNVKSYGETVNLASQLNPKYLLATHYQPIILSDVREFLEACDIFNKKISKIILNIFKNNAQPICFSTIIDQTRKELSIPKAEYQYALLVLSHLRDLEKKKIVFQTDHSKNIWLLN